MNIPGLKTALDNLKENAGMGLISADVFGKEDGLSISGYNPNPRASALFNRVFDQVIKSLKSSGFPPELDYYYLMLKGKKCVIVGQIEGHDYMYGVLANLNHLSFGLLMNVVLPEFIEQLNEAL